MALGLVQRNRAVNVSKSLAASRGHIPVRVTAKPTLGNLILWKTIYEYQDSFYIDAARVLFSKKSIEGGLAKKFSLSSFKNMPTESTQYQDIKKFLWFCDDWVSLDSEQRNVLIDMRYSFLPNSIKGMWGIEFDTAKANSHISYANLASSFDREKFVNMLLGKE